MNGSTLFKDCADTLRTVPPGRTRGEASSLRLDAINCHLNDRCVNLERRYFFFRVSMGRGEGSETIYRNVDAHFALDIMAQCRRKPFWHTNKTPGTS